MKTIKIEDVLNAASEFGWKVKEIQKSKPESGKVVFDVGGGITAIIEKKGAFWKWTARKEYQVLGEVPSMLELKVNITEKDLQGDLHVVLILEGMIEEIKRISRGGV